MSLTRFTPLSDVVSLRDAMDQLFQESFIRPNGLAAGQIGVPVDLWETKDAYRLRADLPGLTPEDIEINVTGDTVTVSGEHKVQTGEAKEGWLRQERRTGKFQRTFTLPTQIESDTVSATFTNGVLDLVLPKAESTKPKSVKITAK